MIEATYNRRIGSLVTLLWCMKGQKVQCPHKKTPKKADIPKPWPQIYYNQNLLHCQKYIISALLKALTLLDITKNSVGKDVGKES